MLNLSLSGCGFLGIYHIGVISAFREHAPEFIQNNKISGCSAGSLVAACAVCDCCLGQMVSDVLEIALKARSHALGPLHPSFNIVDILKNGLRRILPVDAHKICSGRVHISLTRWKDGKNFLVNQFDSREELIQALICSSFVPCYSGFLPPKFKGTYYWDGGLSNNNPILDQDTILVSPFGGEADICPRDESASYYCYDFQGTNLQWSYENIYRISKALFPPNPQVLKAMCFRGYKDAVSFLKSRNLLQCSCYRLREKTSISSVIGEDLNAYTLFDENEIGDENESSLYDSEEDNIIQYAQSNPPLVYQEMPVSVCEILDAACDDNKGIINYVYDSQLSRAISIIFLPWTLPFEFSFSFTKRVLELVPKINVSPNSSSVIDTLLLLLNYIIHKFTYDRYQYHSRVTCKLCIGSSSKYSSQSLSTTIQFNECHHGNTNNMLTKNDFSPNKIGFDNINGLTKNNSNVYIPKICARHRIPSICSSETNSITGAHYRFRKSRRNRSYVSQTSDLASSVDLNEFKSSKSYAISRRRKNNSITEGYSKRESTARFKKSIKSLEKLNMDEKTTMLLNKHDSNNLLNTQHDEFKTLTSTTTQNRVHFHLNNNTDDENEKNDLNVSKIGKPYINDSFKCVSETCDKLFNISSSNKLIQNSYTVSFDEDLSSKYELYNNDNDSKLNDDSYSKGPFITEPDENVQNDDIKSSTPSNTLNIEEMNNNDSKDPMEWDSYWDNLELNAIGRVDLNL